MIVFPNAKINLGLRVLGKRPDGYHDISTVMVPVGWCDILEIVPSAGNGSFSLSGSALGGCPPEKNLVIKAIRALEADLGHSLPPLDIYLRKIIPDGAGLGGGSSDASFTLKAVNELLSLGISPDRLAAIAARIGADCPFFIYNRPMLAEGIGERLSPVSLPIPDGCAVAIAKPQAEAVSTREAYEGITPAPLGEGESLPAALALSPDSWQTGNIVRNDFQDSIFPLRPVIESTLDRMKALNPLYAAMSGSGAAVFGIFPCVKLAEEALEHFPDCRVFAGQFPFC